MEENTPPISRIPMCKRGVQSARISVSTLLISKADAGGQVMSPGLVSVPDVHTATCLGKRQHALYLSYVRCRYVGEFDEMQAPGPTWYEVRV